MNIGIIGHGFVGKALEYGFKDTHNIFIHDKFKKDSLSLKEVLEQSEIIFFCLPTPFNDTTMHIDLTIYDEVIKEASQIVSGKLFVIKSTVVPETTKNYQKKYPNNKFAFNPEFLTEQNSNEDFVNAKRIVLGGDIQSIAKLRRLYRKCEHFKATPIITMSATEAEVVKYQANVLLATRVAVSNVFYDICQRIGADYNTVREGVVSDTRIGNSHSTVTEDRGFGGKCLVAGTNIRLKSGHIVPIEDVEEGDEVFEGGHNSFTKVTKVGKRVVPRTIKIKARGRVIEGSDDHIHMVYEENVLVEKEIKDIKIGDYVYVPKQPTNNKELVLDIGPVPNGYIKWWKEKFTVTNDFARLFGLYLAEGCMSGNKSATIWSFGGHEEKLADEVCEILRNIGLNPYKKLQENVGTFGPSRCWIVRCRSAGLQALFKALGTGEGAHSKDTIVFPNHLVPSLIGGWMEGDGSQYDGTVMAHSESVNLVSKMDTMLLSVGINPQISKYGKDVKISCRDDVKTICEWVNRFQFDVDRYKRDKPYASPTCKPFKDGWIVRVTAIEEGGEQEVYSIETESHLYVANNILTHNCFPKDLAAIIGKGNDVGADVGLLLEVFDYNNRIRENKDWENIAGATSSGKQYSHSDKL